MCYTVGLKRRFLVIVFSCHMLAEPRTEGQNIPNVQRILQDHVSACGPTNLCNPAILRNHNDTYIDSAYCSPCPPCFCDEWCNLLADCCLDIQLNMTKRFSNTTKHSDRGAVCTYEIGFGPTWMYNEPGIPEEYLVIMECPDNFTDMELKEKCENPSANDSMLLVPVSSAKNGLAYRNIGCFECHDAGHPVTWDLMIRKCRKPLLLHTLTTASAVLEKALQSSCIMRYVPSSYLLYQRTCHRQNVINTCSKTDTDPDIDWACTNLNTNVGNRYANLFCSRCNRDARPITIHNCNITGKWKIFDENLNEGCINAALAHMPREVRHYKNLYCVLCNMADNVGRYCSDSWIRPHSSLAMMFDMSSLLGSIEIGDHDGQTCGRREVFDQFKGKCRPTFCPLGKFAKDEICMPLRKDTNPDAYSLFFRLRPVDTLSSDLICNLLHGVQTAIMEKLKKELHIQGNQQVLVFVAFNASSHLYRNESGDLSSNISDDLKSGDSSNDIMVSIDLMVRTALINITKREDILLSAREFSYSITYGQNATYKFQAYTDDTPYSIFKAESGEIAECLVQTEKNTLKNLHFSIVGETLKCKQIELEEDEYSVNVNDFSIFVPTILQTLSISRYVFLGRRARVCLEDYFRGSISSVFETPSHIILVLTRTTSVCSCISLFCIFVTFLTYCIFPDYRTLPGKLNMCLLLAMFFAVLFFEVSYYKKDNSTACIVLGVLVHYSWLCYFASLHSCCLHMYRVFSSGVVIRRDHRQERNHLKQFIIYIIGAPAIVVSMTVVSNVLLFGSPNYKSNTITCFIIEPISRAVAFILPVSLLVLWNIVLFICILRRVNSNPKLPNNSGYQHYVGAFVKLFTLTGITWILQLVDASLEYSEIGYSVLSLTVTVMNSSHGAFIFFAFVCNSRIYHSYRELFSRCRAYFTVETTVNVHANGVEEHVTRF